MYIPLEKGAGSREEHKKNKRIRLLSILRKVYGRILISRQEIDMKIDEKLNSFRKGRSCMDLMVSVRLLIEKYLAKNGKLYAAFYGATKGL